MKVGLVGLIYYKVLSYEASLFELTNLFYTHILSTRQIFIESILGVGDASMNSMGNDPYSHRCYILSGETNVQQQK